MADVASMLRRHERLKSARVNAVESVWRDCYDYTFPLRGNGLNGAMHTAASGQSKQAQLLDSTAADSANILASNIMAGLTPSNSRWFALDVGNESEEERRWLDDAAELLWENVHMANFDAEAFEACLDIVCAGQFALFIDEDREAGGFAFQQWPLATVFIASSRADGRPDTVHREYTLTAEQAEREFGRGRLPKRIADCLTGQNPKPDTEFKFVHIIAPRPEPHSRFAKGLPIASYHVAMDDKAVVRESGYHEMPVVVPRWLRVPDSIYAVGPMYAALPDVRQLNELKAFELAGADIAISGMYLGIDDGVLNPRTVKLGPRKIIIAADKDSLTPLGSGANFNLSDVMVSKLQAAIRKTLMADQLTPQDGPQMTATEVRVRVDMIRQLLGPIYGRLQAEYLKPLVERCFGLAFRAGVFQPPPQSLQGRAFSVRYVSPMARAQKMDDVNAIQQVYAMAAGLAPLYPEIMDQFNIPESIKLVVQGLGAPHAMRRTPEEVQAIQQQRAQAQQAQSQQAGAQQAQQAGMEAAAVSAVGG